MHAFDEHVAAAHAEPTVYDAAALKRLVDGATGADAVETDVICADDDSARTTGGHDGGALCDYFGVSNGQWGLVIDPGRHRKQVCVLGPPDVKGVQNLPVFEHGACPRDERPVNFEVVLVALHQLSNVAECAPALGPGRPRLDDFEDVRLNIVLR